MAEAVISIAQQKGGAGKTTLAAHLAVAWAIAGFRVALLDIDPQGSLGAWFEMRTQRLGAGTEGLSFATVTGWRTASEVRMRSRECDIVVIDSPPHSRIEARLVVRIGDLVLIPVQPSALDIWATRPILEVAKEESVRAILVPNRVSSRSSFNEATAASLANLQAQVATHHIGNRVAFRSSMALGLTALETHPAGDAAKEIRALAKELESLESLESL